MAGLSKRERSIAAKFRRYEKEREKAKKCYDRADSILMEIAAQIDGPKIAKLRTELTAALGARRSLVRITEDGKQLQLREVSADERGILGWGHGAVRQFDLKVVNL